MAQLQLILATPENGLMNAVIAEWDKQLVSQKLPKSILDSLRTYEAQIKPDRSYGVYVLCDVGKNGLGKPPYEAFVHVNHAFPKTPKPVLRLTWSRLAPRYEWEENQADNHGRIFGALINNALALSESSLKSQELKLYLFSAADRSYGRKFVASLKEAEKLTSFKLPLSVSVRGSWLHLNRTGHKS